MPSYNFRNNETGEEFTENMKWSEVDDFCKEKNCIQIPSGSHIGFNSVTFKPADSFRDILKTIKKKHHNSTINTW
jgi:hypothetical protein